MASRTIVLAGVAGIAIAGAAYYLYFMDDAPPPKVAAPAQPVAAAPKAEVAPTPGAPAANPAPGASPSPDDVKAAQARVGDLEKTVVDLQSQIAMKNKAIAELEAKLAKSK
jgi:Tfp pilus assembly protein FimV